jgi:hypothetical protein
MIATQSFAQDASCGNKIEKAIQYLYADVQIKDYVCEPNNECTIEAFARQLEISDTRLRADKKRADTIEITPKTKGTSYFTALFLIEDCKILPVFYPDPSSSGIKILKKSVNGMFIIRSTDRSSRAEWSETDFTYDPQKKAYQEQTTNCYVALGSRTIKKKCE